MRKVVMIVFIVSFSSCNSPGKITISATTAWKLAWSDEFNYKGLPDSSKWNYDTGGHGWGNNELQYYTNADTNNAIVKNGKLFISALKQNKEKNTYTSARLVTKGKGDWLYGRIEVNAKLPAGKGMWPAIWMLPTDWEYGGWPESGEIDIMENVGYNPDSVFCSVHTKSFNHIIGTQKTAGIEVKNNQLAFHTYAIEWDMEKIIFIMDDIPVLQFKNTGKGFAEWPFNKRFHLLLNVAVGGNWGGKYGVAEDIFPARMEVEYVRVFSRDNQQ
jgi:beta-glucanase (GH16 family)